MTLRTGSLTACLAVVATLVLAVTAPAESSLENTPQTGHWYGSVFSTNVFAGYGRHIERRGGGASRTCLTADTRAVLNRLEARFGTVKVISTCRPGAVIAGTNRPSYHRYGKAVDFNVPRGVSEAAVVQWLYANNRGVVMTYRNMGHIHFDTGSYHKIAYGGGGRYAKHRKHYAKRKTSQSYAAAR